MLTKKQLNTLNEMLASADIKGKDSIRKVIWINTTKPKYKVGDKVKVTSYESQQLKLCGTRVINFVGIITKIVYAWLDQKIVYEIEMQLSNGEVERSYFDEKEISCRTTTKNLINKVGNGETSFTINF